VDGGDADVCVSRGGEQFELMGHEGHDPYFRVSGTLTPPRAYSTLALERMSCWKAPSRCWAICWAI